MASPYEHPRAVVYCSICYLGIEEAKDGTATGYNARPINWGRCCKDCFERVVTPARARDVQWMRKRETL